LKNVVRLEEFWNNFVRIFPDTVEVQGAIVACFLPIPVTLFNHVTNVNTTEGRAEAFLKAIVDHFSSTGLPFVCFRVSPSTPPSFVSLLERHGFEKEKEQSIMVLDGEPLGNGINLRVTVKETNDIDAFDRLVVKGFEMPSEWKEAFDKLVAPFKGKDVKHYLAYLDDRPVGTVSLFSTSKVGCILNVSTLKEYRRNGVGTALTAHAISESLKAGNNLHTLQTDRGGEAEKLYRKIGFKSDYTVSFFVKNLEYTHDFFESFFGWLDKTLPQTQTQEIAGCDLLFEFPNEMCGARVVQISVRHQPKPRIERASTLLGQGFLIKKSFL